MRFDAAPLAQPAWWAALALLLVNDNLLKGSGLVAGWLTGKLSDFAFLIVAPVVCAALLPVALPRRRTLAVMSVVGLFVITDLSPSASDALVAGVARLGLAWRLWPDPTDLIALMVLPITLWLLRSRPRAARVGSAHLAWRARAGAVAGALACLATSAPQRYLHHPFFANRTAGEIELRVSWVLRKVDCGTLPAELARSLDAGDLDDPRSMSVASAQVVVLDGPAVDHWSPVGFCHLEDRYGDRDDCVAAILEAGDAQPVLMVARASWRESDDSAMFTCSSEPSPVSKCNPRIDRDEDQGPDAISLVTKGKHGSFDGTREPREPDAGELSDTEVLIADIDVAAIRARAASPETCRPLSEAFAALTMNTSCAADADCSAVPAGVNPGPTGFCAAYVSSAAAADVERIGAAWSRRCTVMDRECPIRGELPVRCYAGVCQECSEFCNAPPGTPTGDAGKDAGSDTDAGRSSAKQ